ncbi:MAG: TolC family protein [Candidatus Spyradosoma sp.]
MRKKFYALCLPALMLSACASYEERPIDLGRETAAWREQSEKIASERTELSFADAKLIGLALNPELNRARARLAGSRAVRDASGWWDDPSVSFSVKRVLNTSAQPWAYTPGVSLTLPVTGLPALAEEAAARYAEEDYWTLAQAEIDFAEALAELWTDCAVVEAKLRVAEPYLRTAREERARLERLFDAGEVTAAELQKENDRVNAAALEKRDLDTRLADVRSRIAARLGLAPTAARALKLVAALPAGVPAAALSPTPEELAELPRVRAALARYAASETALKTEIRRQYPELSLSPSYELDGNDEFADSFTLGIGFTLPLWNRNRRGVAEAEGAREVARIETLALWQDQFHRLRLLEAEQKIAENHCRAQELRSRDFLRRTEKIYAEIAAGETLPTALSEAAAQNFSAQLAYCDALGDFLKARIRIEALRTRNGEK